MSTFEEMKAYVRFGPDDAQALAEFWPHVEPRLREIAAAFYDRILEFEGARTVFSGPEQVIRLQGTMQVWLEELFRGPWDGAYFDRRRRIGEKHVAVRLPHRYMFTAMQVMTDHLVRIAGEVYDPAEAHRVAQAIRRVTTLDLAIMTGTFLGVKERERDTHMASAILAHLPLATLLLDAQGRVRTATEAAAKLCVSDPTGLDVLDALPEALVAASHLAERLQESRQTQRDVDLRRVDTMQDGVARSYRVLITPIAQGEFRTMLIIDELTQMLEDEARRRRHESLVEMGSMSALVAHELRNPLAGISGAIQVIAGSLDKEDRRQPIMLKVRDQIARLDRMVRDLLAFARPPIARLTPIDLAEVVDVVRDLVQSDHPGRVTVVRVGQGRAVADADLVHRVVLNLIQNAVAAMGDREGRVEVHVSEGRILVCDDGPGIPTDHGPRVFEPFFTTKTTGTGLGLSICRNAARAMEAELELVEGPLPGAAFELTFSQACGRSAPVG